MLEDFVRPEIRALEADVRGVPLRRSGRNTE